MLALTIHITDDIQLFPPPLPGNDAKHISVPPQPRFGRLLVRKRSPGNHPGKFGVHAYEADVLGDAGVSDVVHRAREHEACHLVSDADTRVVCLASTNLHDCAGEISSMGFVRGFL